MKILLLMSTMFITNIGFGVILPTLPFLARYVGASTFEMGLALAMFAAAQLLSSSLWGILSDRVGRRPVLIFGIVGYGVATALLGLATNVPFLLILRFLAGALAAAVFPSSLALAAVWAQPHHRARILGYMGSVTGAGFIIGPPVGAFLSVFGLQVPFICVGLLSVVNGLLAFWLLPREQRETHSSLRFRRPKVHSATLLRQAKSLVNGRIAPYLIGTMVFTIADASITATLAYYFTGHLHSSQAMAGWAFMVNGGVAALAQVLIFSRVFKRFGETIIVGFTFGAAGYLSLGLSNFVAWAFVSVAVLALCRGFAYPAMTAAISMRTTGDSQGSSFGSQLTFNSLGRTIGPLIAGWLFAFHERSPYFFSCGLMLVTIGFYLLWTRRAQNPYVSDDKLGSVKETL